MSSTVEPLLTATPEQQPSAIQWTQALVRNELSYIDFHSNQTPEEQPPLYNGHIYNVVSEEWPLYREVPLYVFYIINLALVIIVQCHV